jgi:hypothetical protein
VGTLRAFQHAAMAQQALFAALLQVFRKMGK